MATIVSTSNQNLAFVAYTVDVAYSITTIISVVCGLVKMKIICQYAVSDSVGHAVNMQ